MSIRRLKAILEAARELERSRRQIQADQERVDDATCLAQARASISKSRALIERVRGAKRDHTHK